MRAIWGGISTLLLLVGSAQAATIWNDRVGHWSTGAYTKDETGAFSHCAASADYKSGIYLSFGVNKTYDWTMAFASPKWSLTPGTEYRVSFWVDDRPADVATARAVSANQVLLLLKDSVPLFNAFRRGRTLYVNAQGTDLAFNLTDTSVMLSYLLRCAAAGGAKPAPMVVATPNPFGSPAEGSPSRSTAAPTSTLEAERAEATLVAANLMSELGVAGFKLLRPDEMPKGFMADAMWVADKNVGTVTVLPKADDTASVGSNLISLDAKGCKKAFSSGSAPVEEGSNVTRLFTRCGMGNDALVSLYLVVPRKAGGAYVIGTFATGEEDGAKAIDSGIRAAVFRALPK
jgi:hypothetical protein